MNLRMFGLSAMHQDENWAATNQRTLKIDNGFPQFSDGELSIRGTWVTGSGAYSFTEHVKQLNPDSVQLSASIHGIPTKATRRLCLNLSIPAEQYRGQTIYFDHKPYELPWYSKGEHIYLMNDGIEKVNLIQIPLPQGDTLLIEGDVRPYLQDTRSYGSESFSLMLMFAPSTGNIDAAQLALKISKTDQGPHTVPFNHQVRKPARVRRPPAPPEDFTQDSALVAAMQARVQQLPKISPQGASFVDSQGRPVYFWGTNLASFYPDYDLADKTAEHLASLGMNIVRPHHTMRPSRDWCPPDRLALVRYLSDSRTPCLKAYDRFDYLNAKLREKGIYLSLTIHGTRDYLPEDVSILSVTPADDEAWSDAIDELNHWNWKKAFDSRKMLAVFDERCFQLQAEFARTLLTHVNPYTGLAYAKDPQVISVELINEFSSEYVLVCGNKFPEYFTTRLNARLRQYLQEHGVQPFDLYQARTPLERRWFSQFCVELDRNYARRMEAIIRQTGCEAPLEFSNLWRGDANLRMRSQFDGVVEDHAYEDPLVVADPAMFAYNLTQSAVAHKPMIVGEFNQTENTRLRAARIAERSMLIPAMVAYGQLQDFSGVIWFAWAHGTQGLGPDGWSKTPATAGLEKVGQVDDRLFLDHSRTASLIFRNRYLAPSALPQTIVVNQDYQPTTYNEIMSGESALKPGWQMVHGFRKTFGTAPVEQKDAAWFKAPPSNPIVSDTGQIVRDSQRRQLTFSAAKTEAFSGHLDGKSPAKLAVLEVPGNQGFATVMLVTMDGTPLPRSKAILVSKTYTDSQGNDTSQCPVNLRGLTPGMWTFQVTKPAPVHAQSLTTNAAGVLQLPVSDWNECELRLQTKP